MSEPIATMIDASTSDDDVRSNLDGTVIPSQLSPSTLDPAATWHEEPDQSDVERLRGIYANLLGLAEAGIVPAIGDMTEALGTVGFVVHSEAEVAGFVQFVALVHGGSDARSFEDFLAVLRQSTSKSASPVPKLNVELATPTYGFASEPANHLVDGGDTTLTLADNEGSLFGSRPPSPSIFDSRDSSPERGRAALPRRDAHGASDSLFNSPASSPSRSPTPRSPTRAPPGQLQVADDMANDSEYTAKHQQAGFTEPSRSLLDRKINVDSLSSRLSVSDTPRSHYSRGSLLGGGSTGDERDKLRGDMENAFVQVGLLLDELPEGSCKARLTSLKGNLKSAVNHIDRLEKNLDDSWRLITDSRKFVEEAQEQAKKIAVESEKRHRIEVASLKKASAALQEQLVDSEASLDAMRNACIAAEKRADEADAHRNQLVKEHRRQNLDKAELHKQEVLIEQLEKDKRDLLEKLQTKVQREDTLKHELRVEQRARACTLIWKIAEDKRAQVRLRSIREEAAQPRSPESFDGSAMQKGSDEHKAMLMECERLRSEGSAQQIQLDKFAEEKTRLARENKQLSQAVEKLTSDLNEMLALDTDNRHRNQNSVHMRMNGSLAANTRDDLDPLALDGMYSIGSKDLMQEILSSSDKAVRLQAIPSSTMGGEASVESRVAAQIERVDRIRSALAEKVAAAACYARLTRRRRRRA